MNLAEEENQRFPDSDKDDGEGDAEAQGRNSLGGEDEGDEDDENEDEEGSEGIDEGFLQVASAGSCNTGSAQDESTNRHGAANGISNQDEPAMFSNF